MLKVLAEKYHAVINYRRAPVRPNRDFPQSKDALAKLLVGQAEDERAWIKGATDVPPTLWRVWDGSSQGQIFDKVHGFLAAKCTEVGELNTMEGRQLNIQRHNNFSNRKPTCFLSFSSSLVGCWDFRVPHHRKRGQKKKPARPIKLSLVNPQARKRRGRAVLNMLHEIDAYNALGYANRELVYQHEWLLLYQSPAVEIVWSWWEKDMANWMRVHKVGPREWEETVALPLLAEHERLDSTGTRPEDITKALEAMLQVSMPDALKHRI